MFNDLIEKWRLKRATKQLRLERLHMQELCDHEWEYAGKKEYEYYNGVDSDFYNEYVAVCKHCGKVIQIANKDNLETIINISKIRHSKESS